MIRRGATRAVVLIGRLALKIAIGERGRRCNRFEADLYGRVNSQRREMPCPVIWCSPAGRLLIARRADRELTEEEKVSFMDTDRFPDWDYMPPNDEGQPFEFKASDWGWLDGRLVAVDYSAPALFENSAVDEMSGFRVRLRVRIPKALTSEATNINVMVMNKEVTITSQRKDEPLEEAKWIVLDARGFSTEEAAQQFGTRLRSIVRLAALSSRLGVDVGEDKPTDWMSEDFARKLGLKDHERIAPNIHGLSILPDDDNTRFPLHNFQGRVTADPEHLVSALRELGENDEISFEEASTAVRVLNLALMTSEPLAQMVLAFSAVEELGQNEKWSEAQVALIKELADAAETSATGVAHERAEVADAIRKGLFPLSLRQGVMRLLSRLSLDALRKEWDRLYGIRSGLFHGTARLSDSEINKAAHDTVTLCGRIILAIVAKEGVQLPSITATHFDLSTLGISREGVIAIDSTTGGASIIE